MDLAEYVLLGTWKMIPVLPISFIGLFLLVLIGEKWPRTAIGFLLSNRNLSERWAPFVIASDWIWAPALIAASAAAYVGGVRDALYFDVGNVLAIPFFYLWIAPRIQRRSPEGVTFSQVLTEGFVTRAMRSIFPVVGFIMMVYAAILQFTGLAFLLTNITGSPRALIIASVALLALSFACWQGFRASVLSNVAKTVMVVGLFLIIGCTYFQAADRLGDFLAPLGGGLTGASPRTVGKDILDAILEPLPLFAQGLLVTMGFLYGISLDQQHYEIANALSQKSRMRKAGLFGGLLFLIALLVLQVPGFLAANPALHVMPAYEMVTVPNRQLAGFYAILTLGGEWLAIAYAVFITGSLLATLIAITNAAGSIGSIDLKWLPHICVRWPFFSKAPRQYSHAEYVAVARATMALHLAIAAAFASIPDIPIISYIAFAAMLRTPLWIPILLGISRWRLNEPLLLCGILLGYAVGIPCFWIAAPMNPELHPEQELPKAIFVGIATLTPLLIGLVVGFCGRFTKLGSTREEVLPPAILIRS